MAYNDVPLAAQGENSSGVQLAENFKILKTFIEFDHVPLSSTLGEHNKLTLIRQNPDPAPLAHQVAVYSKLSAAGDTAWCFRIGDTGAITECSALKAVNGYARLASGTLLKWGLANGNGPTIVPYGVGPVFNNVRSIQATVCGAGVGDINTWVTLNNIAHDVNAFECYCSQRRTPGTPTPVQFYWLAIGD